MNLPTPDQLDAHQCLMKVESYDPGFDTFAVACTSNATAAVFTHRSLVPRLLMPRLTGKTCAPADYVGRTFLVEPDPVARLTACAKKLGWIERVDGSVVHENDNGIWPTVFDSYVDLIETSLRHARARL